MALLPPTDWRLMWQTQSNKWCYCHSGPLRNLKCVCELLWVLILGKLGVLRIGVNFMVLSLKTLYISNIWIMNIHLEWQKGIRNHTGKSATKLWSDCQKHNLFQILGLISFCLSDKCYWMYLKPDRTLSPKFCTTTLKDAA